MLWRILLVEIYVGGLLLTVPVFMFFAVLEGREPDIPRAFLAAILWPLMIPYTLIRRSR